MKKIFLPMVWIALAVFLWNLPPVPGEIHEAVDKGDLSRVQELLAKNPGWLDAPDDSGRTPLSIAAMQRERDSRLPGSSYGMGWSSYKISGIQFVSHSGGMFGVGARLTLLPEKNVACVVLTNAASTMQGTDLWDVEWEILKAVIPGFPEAPERQPQAAAPSAFTPPDALVGVWLGKARAGGEDVPAKLTLEKAGAVRLDLAGQESTTLTVPTPLGSLRFLDGVLLAQFMAGMKTADTARSPHILLLAVKIRGERLDGSLSAVAMNQHFCYPHWIEFNRQK